VRIVFDEPGQPSAGTAGCSGAALRRHGSEQSGDGALALDVDDLIAFPEAMHDLGELGLDLTLEKHQ
jgi:hypothetical protein